MVAARSADVGIGSGLQAGDAIDELNGTLVNSVDTLRSRLAGMKRGDAVALLIERDGKSQYVGFEIE